MKEMNLQEKRKKRSVDLHMTGKLLRTRLDRAGLSVKQVQKVLGLECPQSIYRWLNRILSCSMEDLIVTRDRPQQIRCAAYFTALKK